MPLAFLALIPKPVKDFIAGFGLYIAIGIGSVVGYLLWEHRIENRGVEKERASVIKTGKKIAKKAGDAAAAAERDPRGVLRTWQRD